MRRSASKSSLTGTDSTVAITSSTSSSSTLSVNTKADSGKALPPPPLGTPSFSPIPMVQAANAALMERTPFAIDDAKDDEDESDEETDGAGDDDQVLDEVCCTLFHSDRTSDFPYFYT